MKAMCTVVYLPSENGVCLASLRDENPARPKANKPAFVQNENVPFLSPTDPEAGGTWIGVNELGSVIVLLNGGFVNHEKRNLYRKSRGLIVAELLATEMPVIEWSMMDMEEIEHYTLVVFTEGNLFQLVWDGHQKHRIMLDNSKPHLWSSSTLYSEEAKATRSMVFEKWLATNPPFTKLSLLCFFRSINDGENGFLINRNEAVKTLSYSFIEMQQDTVASFSYNDFNSGRHYKSKINILQKAINHCLIAS